jgi:hypothetical protein
MIHIVKLGGVSKEIVKNIGYEFQVLTHYRFVVILSGN